MMPRSDMVMALRFDEICQTLGVDRTEAIRILVWEFIDACEGDGKGGMH